MSGWSLVSLASFYAVLCAVGVDSTGSLVAVASVGLGFWALHRFSGALVLAVMGAREADTGTHGELYAVVDRLSLSMGLCPPRLYTVDSPVPNAFVTGWDGRDAAIGVTRGLLSRLDRGEMTAVIAHELAHLSQRRQSSRAAALALGGGVSLIAGAARSLRSYSAARRGPCFALLLRALALALKHLDRLSDDSPREFAADAVAVRICGNPAWLISALGKLQAGEQAPAGRGAGHPVVAERIRRLEAMAHGAYLS